MVLDLRLTMKIGCRETTFPFLLAGSFLHRYFIHYFLFFLFSQIIMCGFATNGRFIVIFALKLK